MTSNLIPILTSIAGIFAGGFALLKYSIATRQKEREETFKLFESMQDRTTTLFKTMQEQMINLYSQKNNQLERISFEFSKNVKESTKQAEITREKLTQAIIDLRRTVENNTSMVRDNTSMTQKALSV